MIASKIIDGEFWFSKDLVGNLLEEVFELEDLHKNAEMKSDKYFDIIQRQSLRILELENQLSKKWWQFWK